MPVKLFEEKYFEKILFRPVGQSAMELQNSRFQKCLQNAFFVSHTHFLAFWDQKLKKVSDGAKISDGATFNEEKVGKNGFEALQPKFWLHRSPTSQFLWRSILLIILHFQLTGFVNIWHTAAHRGIETSKTFEKSQKKWIFWNLEFWSSIADWPTGRNKNFSKYFSSKSFTGMCYAQTLVDGVGKCYKLCFPLKNKPQQCIWTEIPNCFVAM